MDCYERGEGQSVATSIIGLHSCKAQSGVSEIIVIDYLPLMKHVVKLRNIWSMCMRRHKVYDKLNVFLVKVVTQSYMYE